MLIMFAKAYCMPCCCFDRIYIRTALGVIFLLETPFKGPPRVRVISFDISRVSSALFRRSISFYDSIIYPLLTCISKLPCFVLCLDMGQGTVYQLLGFVVVISKKMHSHCYFIMLSVGDGFFHIVC